MQRTNHRLLIRAIRTALFFFMVLSNAQASRPLWSFTPQTPTTITLAKGSNAQVIYTIQNHASRAKTLFMKPMNGISQNAACQLPSKGHCTLALNVNGALLKDNVVGGPLLCQQGNPLECYQPDLQNILRITLEPTAPLPQFSINPVGVHPTSIRNGDHVLIHFLVKNISQTPLSEYRLSPLPANVKQRFSSSRYPTTTCNNPLSLAPGEQCVLALAISGPTSFEFSLCKDLNCPVAATAVALKAQSLNDPTFPYGVAPDGNVCVTNDYYATPETMLGSWAMLEAVTMDITSGELSSSFQDKIVYAVGTAALGNYYGFSDCGGGCNALNGYCFAIKFNQKTAYPYMIFQSVNIAANDNSFDIYMAGGGCGAFCDACQIFWGSNTTSWENNILGAPCADYFGDYSDINAAYSVTYNGTAYPAKQTLSDACNFASSNVSGFNTQNFDDITFVPVTCPTALTQVTGVALPSSIQTIGINSVSAPLIPIAELSDASFSGPTAISTATTTQMQDCKTPSSGYCGNVLSSITNYQASISASTTAPLLSNAYCSKNPGVVGFCSWDNCGSSGSDYCNTDEATCNGCGGGAQWCTC